MPIKNIINDIPIFETSKQLFTFIISKDKKELTVFCHSCHKAEENINMEELNEYINDKSKIKDI